MTEKEIREQQEWQIIVKLTKGLIEKKRREAEGEKILNEIRQRKNILYDI